MRVHLSVLRQIKRPVTHLEVDVEGLYFGNIAVGQIREDSVLDVLIVCVLRAYTAQR